MGCDVGDVLSWIADPIGNAIGIQGPGTLLTHPWDMGEAVANDWSVFKHLLVADMRKDRESQLQNATNARTIVYGKTRVGNTIAYAESTGDQNQTLHVLCIFAGHEIDGYEEIWFDDKLVATVAGGWVAQAPYAGFATIELFDGTQTVACASMVAASAGGWTNEHKLLGLAYAHITLTYNEGVYPTGIPSIKAVLRGKKVLNSQWDIIEWSDNPAYCIRDYMAMPINQGGMGCDVDEINDLSIAIAANTSYETVYSNMPPDHAPGVKTVSKFIPGETPLYPEPRYTMNGIIRLDGVPTQIIKSMLTSCAGDALYSGGEWKIYAAATAATVETLDESWLNGGISFQTGNNKSDKFNTVKGTFTNSNDYWADSEFYPVPIGATTPPNTTHWTESVVPYQYDNTYTYSVGNYAVFVSKVYKVYNAAIAGTKPTDTSYWELIEEYDAGVTYLINHVIQRAGIVYVAKGTVPAANAYLTEDGGEVLTANIALPFTITSSEAQRLAKITLEKSRRGLMVNYPCNHKAFKLDVMNVVAVNNTRLGWNAKLFRIVNWSFSLMGGTKLALVEYDAAIYTWVPGDSTPLIAPLLTNLPDPRIVKAITDLTATETLYIGNTVSVIMTKINLSWQVAEAQSLLFDIYLDGVYLFTSRDTTAEIKDISTGVHTFGVAAGNTLGAKSPIVNLVYTVLGKTEAPPDIDIFLVTPQQDGTRQFVWLLNNEPLDLTGYYIRFKRGTDAIWEEMSPLHTGILLASPFENNQLAAGDYVFAIKAIDTTGNESLNAKYIETTLPDPRLANVWAASISSDSNWPGTKTDCEVVTDGTLEATDTTTTWDGLTTWDDYTQWKLNPNSPITYETPVLDMGGAILFTPQVIAYGIGTITVQMATSEDDVTWSSWGDLAAMTIRYAKFLITVNATSPIIASLKEVSAFLVVKPILEEINDKNISTLTGANRIGTGDIRLPITNTYDVIRQVSVTLQNVGSGWSWELIDKDVTVGPRIKIYNGSTLADCVIDAYIKGL